MQEEAANFYECRSDDQQTLESSNEIYAAVARRRDLLAVVHVGGHDHCRAFCGAGGSDGDRRLQCDREYPDGVCAGGECGVRGACRPVFREKGQCRRQDDHLYGADCGLKKKNMERYDEEGRLKETVAPEKQEISG